MDTTRLGLDLAAAALRLATALIFAVSAVHKLRLGAAFAGIVAAYRLLPRGLVAPLARLLPVLELGTGALLLCPSAAALAVAPALALLLPMTAAVAINLARGRDWIDCGCGGTLGQGLSRGLLWRNVLLMLLLCGAARPLEHLDSAAVLLALAAAGVLSSLYFSSSQLLANARQWRLLAGGEGA